MPDWGWIILVAIGEIVFVLGGAHLWKWFVERRRALPADPVGQEALLRDAEGRVAGRSLAPTGRAGKRKRH